MAVALVGTLDTKGPEVAFLRDRLAAHGQACLVVDVGLFEPDGIRPDVGRQDVMAAAGVAPSALLRRPRGAIMSAMARGLAAVLGRLAAGGRLAGVLGVGGNQGTAVVCAALRALPHGLPKLVVSTVASGNLRPHLGSSDVAVLASVADLVGGPNPVVEPVLRNAAAAMAGMVAAATALPVAAAPLVAVTALGNTHPAVARALATLRARGFAVAAFHASGAGGPALERLVADGRVAAVLDLTPHELTEEVVGAGWYQPVQAGRCTAAGRAGIPQVVVPGALEYLCFGPRASLPPRFRRRRTYAHNPACVHVPASRAEMAAVGAALARRLNRARGPVALVVPMQGWSVYGRPGGPLDVPGARAAFLRALDRTLHRRVLVHRLPLHVNDPAFVDHCCAVLLDFLGRAAARAAAG